MPEAAPSAAPRQWKPPPLIANERLRWGLWIGAAVYLALALGTMEVNWARVADGIPRGQRFLAAFFPPDFVSRWDAILDGIFESLWMTVISTVVGIAISIPVALGAARNLSPKPKRMAMLWLIQNQFWRRIFRRCFTNMQAS